MLLEDLIKKYSELEKLLMVMPKKIKEKCNVKMFPAKSLILTKDINVEFVYIICKGEAKGVNEFGNGNLYVLEKIKPFAFIGELAVLAEEMKASVTIEAVTDCITVQIPREEFCKWLEIDNIVSMTVVRGIAKKYYYLHIIKEFNIFIQVFICCNYFLLDKLEQK